MPPLGPEAKTLRGQQKYFCTVYDYAGKADLNMGYWNPERKIGGGGAFFRDN